MREVIWIQREKAACRNFHVFAAFRHGEIKLQSLLQSLQSRALTTVSRLIVLVVANRVHWTVCHIGERVGWEKVLFGFEGFRCIQFCSFKTSCRPRVAPAGGQSDAPHGQARPARVFPALCPVMDPLHLPVARQPHLPLLSQEEQQRIHHDVCHEQVQNGERSRCRVVYLR